MRHTVYEEPARTADTLPAVVFESYGNFPLVEEVLVESIQHFKE
jgi:hypothetical protein